MADTISGLVREVDIPARLGGDEFVVIPDGDEDVAVGVSRRLLRCIDALGGDGPRVTLSVGVANGCVGSLGDVLDAADRAVFQAKSLGKNRVAVA